MRLLTSISLALIVLAGACQTGDSSPPTRSTTQPTVAPVESVPESSRAEQADAEADPTPDGQLVVEVVREFPHDTMAFTQGYLMEQGRLFESTGSRPEPLRSTLREVDPETGDVLRSVDLGQAFFGEGIELIGDEIYMITWRENTAFVFGRESFEVNRTFTYGGEGWGLCLDDHDGNNRLVMSDGSETLTFRDPVTFEPTGTLQLRHDGSFRLNELECVDGFAYANVWTTDIIVRIDLATGDIASTIDASSLQRSLGGAGNVLNGIAYDEDTNNFLVTGKLWPSAFEVRFVPR